jgi:hypothetical protein
LWVDVVVRVGIDNTSQCLNDRIGPRGLLSNEQVMENSALRVRVVKDRSDRAEIIGIVPARTRALKLGSKIIKARRVHPSSNQCVRAVQIGDGVEVLRTRGPRFVGGPAVDDEPLLLS